MSSEMEDKLKGVKDKVVGKAKEIYGEIVDDPDKELEGKLQHAKGHAETKIGKAKDEADDKLKDAKEKAEETSDNLKRKINDKIDDWKE
ncbi:Hypothetical protein Tpal_1357 [Trichococcus palustris]|jgi:uncharacterized protein YjbJ (UPF0337 family)|uniref:CsbD-like domain-containing protein n=1 Tax=Trichococcus palustris TaxID=140314 RepID=A0A143YJ93_9LACT|nr:CsbD family protein [Trichococcus palustris]CZQ91094.1 Hypothetical protein Tpal_1357 [Trichococcus palustris]SFL02785.1 CsbD-like [Trichococcus palustris]